MCEQSLYLDPQREQSAHWVRKLSFQRALMYMWCPADLERLSLTALNPYTEHSIQSNSLKANTTPACEAQKPNLQRTAQALWKAQGKHFSKKH